MEGERAALRLPSGAILMVDWIKWAMEAEPCWAAVLLGRISNLQGFGVEVGGSISWRIGLISWTSGWKSCF